MEVVTSAKMVGVTTSDLTTPLVTLFFMLMVMPVLPENSQIDTKILTW